MLLRLGLRDTTYLEKNPTAVVASLLFKMFISVTLGEFKKIQQAFQQFSRFLYLTVQNKQNPQPYATHCNLLSSQRALL